MYDLKLIPIHQEKGQPIPRQRGFIAASPPRRAARSREEDMLILSLIINGDAQAAAELQDSWLEKFVEPFFKTGGSVTSALRSFIETLNLTMMEKNLKAAGAGAAVTGAITLAAVHRRAVYIAQSGLTHAYALTQAGLGHFHDASRLDRGLGLSRTPTIRYYQADLGSGGYLFMSDSPAPTWTQEQLCKDGFPNLEQLHRRLMNQSSPDLRLDLVQILPGEGQITTISPVVSVPAAPERAEVSLSDQERVAIDALPLVDESPEETVIDDTQPVLPPEDETALEQPVEEELVSAPEDELTDQDEESRIITDGVEKEPLPALVEPGVPHEISDQDQPPERARPPEAAKARKDRKAFADQVDEMREEGLKGLAKFFRWWGGVREKLGTAFKKIFARGGSAEEAGVPALSLRTSLIIVIAVPLLVVGIAVGVYLSRGRVQQHQYYLAQAETAIASAQAVSDPVQAREALALAIQFLDQAESFRSTDETKELRTNTQHALDVFDGALRLSYHPAILGTLSEGINITRIISYGMDLYMLDATAGRLIHATRGSQGYQIDSDFLCDAGNYSGGTADLLVDATALPINNPYLAHVLAADAKGNVIYCSPGQEPVVQTLPRGVEAIGAVTRIAYEGNFLYVLDPTAEAVRVYRSTNGQFLDEPTVFFGRAKVGEIPPLRQMVDIAVNGAELYLLRSDGMLSHCLATGLSDDPVHCENPVEYIDGRTGKEDQPVTMPDSRFAAVLYTAPPDPTVDILDAENADIFRFSLRFRLYQRMRSDIGNYEVVSPAATAFTIGVDRIAFIAFGHQVFWAYVE